MQNSEEITLDEAALYDLVLYSKDVCVEQAASHAIVDMMPVVIVIEHSIH